MLISEKNKFWKQRHSKILKSIVVDNNHVAGGIVRILRENLSIE